MRQLVLLLCVLGVFAAGVQADSITSRGSYMATHDADDKPVRIVDITFDLESFATGVVYGPGDYVEVSLGDVTLSAETLSWEVYAGPDANGNPTYNTVTHFFPALTIPNVTLQISRPGSFFTFTDISEAAVPGGGVPAEWGSVSLDPFVDMFNPAKFRFDVGLGAGFAVMEFSGVAGDFGPSDQDLVMTTRSDRFLIYNNNVAPGDSAFKYVSFDGLPNTWDGPGNPLPDNFYEAWGGSPEMPQSVWWDNLTFSIVAVDDLPRGGFGGGFGDMNDPNSLIDTGYIPGLGLPAQPIPEPGTLALLGLGLAAGVLLRRRRR